MTREEAIARWTGIIPSVFKAEDKLRPQLTEYIALSKKAELSEDAVVYGYCRMIAEEIVSHTSDEQLKEME